MNPALTLHDESVTPIASCLGNEATDDGLRYHDGQTCIAIGESTTGLFVSNDESIRILWAPSQVARSTPVLHYTIEGFRRRVNVDWLTDPHDVLRDGLLMHARSVQLQDRVRGLAIAGRYVLVGARLMASCPPNFGSIRTRRS